MQGSLGRREIEAAQRVLKSGNLRAGRVTEDFEKCFAAAVGAPYAVAVNSGTVAFYLACRTMLSPGDEAIVPGFTDLPVSTRLAKSVLSLPVHPGLSKQDLAAIVEAVRGILKAD